MLCIGIDPGDHTGLAVWHTVRKEFVLIGTFPLHRAMQEVYKYAVASEYAALRGGRKVHVVFEDARQRTWFQRERSNSEYRGKLMGAGAAKRDAAIWEEFLSDVIISGGDAPDRGCTFTARKPQAGATKWSAETFARVTGYTGRTSNHARDAALLVYGMR